MITQVWSHGMDCMCSNLDKKPNCYALSFIFHIKHGKAYDCAVTFSTGDKHATPCMLTVICGNDAIIVVGAQWIDTNYN